MYRRGLKGSLKHIDFILLNILSLALALTSSYFIYHELFNVYLILSFSLSELLVLILFQPYKNVMKKKLWRDVFNCFIHTFLVSILTVFFLFLIKSDLISERRMLATVFLLNFSICLTFWIINKVRVRRIIESKSVLLVTTEARLNKISEILKYNIPRAICVIDKDLVNQNVNNYQVVANKDNLIDYICKNWVDEVFFDFALESKYYDEELINNLLAMGISTHVKIIKNDVFNEKKVDSSVEKFDQYFVLTKSSKMVSNFQWLIKRFFDILGGLAGTILTGLIFIFIAPLIYFNSPGPIFFTHERIGLNGKHFKMYKFRSMVVNAEELKKQYADQNRLKDGMMFKLDFDPRIIGNKIVDGKQVTGIGEFIRKTSLDEFPQFINVLKGDMSLVGTRPPTLDEWEKYLPHHRARMATRPGITGLWQVSGRSNITDFEEIVKLDREYINNWSLWLDIKILFKTVLVVLNKDGSM